MAEAENRPPAVPSVPSLLDRGYDALRSGSWEDAARCFDAVLRQDPHSGFGCLGVAMTANRIHSPNELSRHWDSLSRQTAFQKLLSPVPEDFLSWLQTEMETLKGSQVSASPEDEAPASEEDTVLEYSSPGRKLLLGFAALQVLLLLGTALCLWLSDPDSASPSIAIPGCLFLSVLICGLPVILGPVYGNSIVEAGRFETLLKVLNIIVSVIGCFGTVILTAAFFSEWQAGGPECREARWSCFAYALAFLTYLSGLVFPIILNKVEYG